MIYYHPETLEHIRNPLPTVADWAGGTEITPPAYNPATQTCRFVSGAWVVSATGPTLAEKQTETTAAVDRLCAEKMAAGYLHDFGTGGAHTLQTREDDRPNWLAVLVAAQAKIIAGQGTANLPPGIRTLDNTVVPVTANEAQAAMLGMQAHLAAVLARAWALKDAANSATTPEALALVEADINNGWPA